MENKIILSNHLFEYVITYKKIKNIYFRIKEDLKIHISCNKHVSKSYIESLLKNNENAIINMYNKQLEKNLLSKDIYYLGNKLILNYYNGNPYLNNDYIYALNEEEANKYIESLALGIFNKRLERIKSIITDLPDFKLKARKMTSKWGVCNIKSMTVTLNTSLIHKDVHLIDYVIIHELCHFKHMDHSPSFWKEVSKYYPYYKKARKELNY